MGGEAELARFSAPGTRSACGGRVSRGRTTSASLASSLQRARQGERRRSSGSMRTERANLFHVRDGNVTRLVGLLDREPRPRRPRPGGVGDVAGERGDRAPGAIEPSGARDSEAFAEIADPHISLRMDPDGPSSAPTVARPQQFYRRPRRREALRPQSRTYRPGRPCSFRFVLACRGRGAASRRAALLHHQHDPRGWRSFSEEFFLDHAKPSKPWGWRSRRCRRTSTSCARSTRTGNAATSARREWAEPRDRVPHGRWASAERWTGIDGMAGAGARLDRLGGLPRRGPRSTASSTTSACSCWCTVSGRGKTSSAGGWSSAPGGPQQRTFHMRRHGDEARPLLRPRPRPRRPRPGGVGDVAGERGDRPGCLPSV